MTLHCAPEGAPTGVFYVLSYRISHLEMIEVN